MRDLQYKMFAQRRYVFVGGAAGDRRRWRRAARFGASSVRSISAGLCP
jgi:hypothetical protein